MGLILAALAAVSALGGFALDSGEKATQTRQPTPVRRWLGAAGELLPFASDDDVKSFLLTAEIVETERIGVGVTDPIRVTLQQGDVTAHAIFRNLDTVYDRVRLADGRVRIDMRDSCFFELAAYELSVMLGMDNVPPAVKRSVRGEPGTLQMWIRDAIMEGERLEQEERAPNRLAWMRQVQTMYLFDALIGNDDRTAENILIDANWKLWLIDHTRAFYMRAELDDLEKVIYVDRRFWEGLRALDADLLNRTIGGPVTGPEIAKLLERRDRLVEFVNGLVETRGEDAVFFERR